MGTFPGLSGSETPTGKPVTGNFCPQPRISSSESPALCQPHARAACPSPSWVLCCPAPASSASPCHPRLRWTSSCSCSCCWESPLLCSSMEWVRTWVSWAGVRTWTDGEQSQDDLTSLGWNKVKNEVLGLSDQQEFGVSLCGPTLTTTRERIQVLSQVQSGVSHSHGAE